MVDILLQLVGNLLSPGESHRRRNDARDQLRAALLALSHFHDALADWTKDPPRALTATLQAARRAVELDDDDWLSHALPGIAVLWTSRNYDSSSPSIWRAVQRRTLQGRKGFCSYAAKGVPYLSAVTVRPHTTSMS
jgi:hypothetical protein